MNLNKHDFQSKGIYDVNGVAPSLYSGEKRYGGGECYVLAFNTNDSAQSRSVGLGENSPTLKADAPAPAVMEKRYADIQKDGSPEK